MTTNSIQYPSKITIQMLVSALMLFGIISVFLVNFSLFPIIKNPALSIVVEYPGADSDTVEKTITIPLEDQISTIGGITEIRSQSEKGKALIRLDFESRTNLDLKTLEIKEKIESTVGRFPKDVRKPKVLNFDPTEMPIAVVSLKVTDPKSMGELRTYADTVLKKTLEAIEGISKVTVSGGKVKEILISFDMQKLNVYNLSLTDLYNAIHFNNLSSTVASIEEKNGLYQVRLRGKFSTIEDLVDLPITSLDMGKIVRLGDLAKIESSYRDEDNAYRVNGNENIGVYVYKKHDANILQISSDIKNAAKKINEQDRQIEIIFNQAENIKSAYINAVSIVLLTVIFFFVSIRRQLGEQAVGIFATTIFQLIFIFLIFVFVHFVFKIDFDLLSILSIYLSFAFWTLLYSKLKELEFNKTTQRSLFLFLLLSFPCLFIPTIILNPTIGTNLLRLSLLTSLGVFFLYLSYQYIKSPSKNSEDHNTIEFKTIPVKRTRKNNEEDNSKTRLGQNKNVTLLLAFLLAVLTAAILYIRSPKEVYFNIEDDRIYGYIELPSDSSFSYTDKIVRNIESKLIENRKTKDVISQIESGHAFLIINYDKNIFFKENIIPSLNESVGKQNPAYCYFTKESELGRMKEISLDVIGSDHSTLNKTVPQVANAITNLPGIHEVILNFKPPRNELQLDLNSKNSLVPNSEIGSFLRTILQGSVVSKFNENNNELDIRIRASKEYRESEKQLNRFLIKNNIGQFSPIGNLYSQKESASPIKLFRKNKRPSLSLSIRTDSYSAISLLQNVKNTAKNILNLNERIELNDRIEKLSKSKTVFTTHIILLISICFFLLVAFTESLTKASGHFLSVIFAYSIFLSLYLIIFKTYDISLHIGSAVVLVSLMLEAITKLTGKENTNREKLDLKLFYIAFMLYIPFLLFANPELLLLKNVIGFFLCALFLSKFALFSFDMEYNSILNLLFKRASNTLRFSRYWRK
ncbi:efflux RND transporter permease subunit [Leptospira sp. FAT2]|uniref:efflux RND transporter permease subunit n=1 Tax=Leptospira sanjuanensis TaxID=2879643 RepID=UPI001EE87B88|nr:efflux RND transporter permease subunit [Leptospira sanjuanensis]MCG6167172.1 efflux RND transporter permease subunit [Leptospira sanjuanensis]MCG6192631.1 efflux RND transporter permease subunit [Leptospira sanjuanensis]